MHETYNNGYINFMQDSSTRQALGMRIKQLRKNKRWTQKELANKIGCSQGQLNKYESGLNAPSLELLVLLANVFSTSIDYLITGEDKTLPIVRSQRLIQRFEELEHFNDEDKEVVIKVLDAMIAKQHMEKTLKSMSDK